MRTSRSLRRVILAVLALALTPPAGYVAWNQWHYNFGVVTEGSLYRAGQMPASVLAQSLQERHFKTVLNLRGSNAGEPWYRAERKVTLDAGATLMDISMSSCEWMSRAQLKAVVRALETAERPMLVHCHWGSERTGLVAAYAQLLRPGSTLDDARAELSLRYLYVRMRDGKVMADHLDQYEAWLRRHRLAHSPGTFRRWVNEGFEPQRPSREFWPYDPKPLIAVTRPPSAPAVARSHSDEPSVER